MILYALRLLVALLTFAVGIAAAWLFDFKSAPANAERGHPKISYVVTSDVPLAEPPRSCPLERHPVVAGGIINGKAISKPQPVYPPDAEAARVSGTVTVQVEVDENGSVAKADAVSGPEMLRGAAEDAARAARFSPTRLSGQPVRVSGVITYNFVLQ
ncbi:MAG: energy transducer TonB [Pyrinomonadaceae bacterium]